MIKECRTRLRKSDGSESRLLFFDIKTAYLMRFFLMYWCKRNKTGKKYVAEAFNERFEDMLNLGIGLYESHKGKFYGYDWFNEILYIEKAQTGFDEYGRKLLPVNGGTLDQWQFDDMMSHQFEPKDRIQFDDIFVDN